jgi:hypothetical protein
MRRVALRGSPSINFGVIGCFMLPKCVVGATTPASNLRLETLGTLSIFFAVLERCASFVPPIQPRLSECFREDRIDGAFTRADLA